MSTIDLDWYTTKGYVRFVVTGVAAGYTVKRLADSGRLLPVAGFETDAWISGGSGYGEDYRPPLGETLTYVIAPVDSGQDDSGYVRATVDSPPNEAWLRDVAHPVQSTQVRVITTGTETESVIQHIYGISGRRLPLVVHDVRHGRSGTVTLLVEGQFERAAVDLLLATGSPLLLTMCSSKMWAPCMMAIGAAGYTRIGNKDNWQLALDYVEVEDPLVDIERIPGPLWQNVLNGEPLKPGEDIRVETWQFVKDNYTSWFGAAIGSRV
jgi:hypothetical protein